MNVYLLRVEFSSYEVAMENSIRPETGEFGAFLATLYDGPLKFRNRDVLREEDLWVGPWRAAPRRYPPRT